MRIVTAVFLLAAPAVWAQNADLPAYIARSAKGVNFYSLDRERDMGTELAGKLAGTLVVVHDAALERYVTALGNQLAAQMQAPYAYTFTLYEDRRPAAAPAVFQDGAMMPLDALQARSDEPLAVAGGPVFIPLRLLAEAPNEAVLAFQVAHAMAHIAARHSTKQLTRADLMSLSVQSLGVQNVADRGASVPAGLLQLARAFEREADYVALRVMSEAGYNPDAMADYLGGQPADGNAAVSVRPTPAERVEAIRAETLKLPGGGHPADTGGFEAARKAAAVVR